MELNEHWPEQMVEEYKRYLYDKKMNDYVYNCLRTDPYVTHDAHVMMDDDQWGCILGDLLTGVAGFGDTPEKACAEFDRIWHEGKLGSMKN